jgi:hypothetical protein
VAGFLLFYPSMRGFPRNIAILLALCALAVTGVASTAEAKGGGNMAAAAAKMSRGAQIRVNRMKVKMALRTRGMQQQKTRRQLRLGKRQLMRAMGRREVGLHGSESERTRAAFVRNLGDRGPDASMEAPVARKKDNRNEEELEKLGLKQRKKMRVAAKRRAIKAFKKLRRRGDD